VAGKTHLELSHAGKIEILTETGVQFLIWHCVVPWACDQIFPSQFFSENIIYSYLLILLLPAFVLVVVFFKEMLVFQNTIKMQVIFERFQSNHAQFGSGTAGDVFLSRSGVISKSSPMLEIQCLAIQGRISRSIRNPLILVPTTRTQLTLFMYCIDSHQTRRHVPLTSQSEVFFVPKAPEASSIFLLLVATYGKAVLICDLPWRKSWCGYKKSLEKRSRSISIRRTFIPK